MPDNQLLKPQTGGTVSVRHDLAEEITVGNDLSTAAAAAAAKAEIEARILTAKKWRRDEDQAREDILKRCRHPAAAESFLFSKPVGRKKDAEGNWQEERIEDFSIRFVEMAIGYWGNLAVSSRIIYDDPRRALLRVDVVDLQRNSGYSTESMQDKVVERREIKKGRTVLGMRENSWGDPVYLVEATKDEFRNVLGTERSKLIRDNGKRLLPRDLLDEARGLIDRTLADENAKDPDAAKKKVLDRFAGLGISATMLKEYLERPVEALTAKDLTELSALYNGLKESAFTWPEVMRMKNEPAEGEEKPEGAPPKKLRDRIMAQAKEPAAKEPAPPVQQSLTDPGPPPTKPTK